MAYETDVLIIGAGPTGSTTALALANSGVRCHTVSRGNWMADSPRAHITNQRANEVLAWVAAFGAFSTGGHFTMDQEFYEAIPGWIAGMAMMAGRQADANH
jgi:2-polyprenyl-6-methoxyphenol hydroxylase-like FAD-dependent oxidoreductase